VPVGVNPANEHAKSHRAIHGLRSGPGSALLSAVFSGRGIWASSSSTWSSVLRADNRASAGHPRPRSAGSIPDRERRRGARKTSLACRSCVGAVRRRLLYGDSVITTGRCRSPVLSRASLSKPGNSPEARRTVISAADPVGLFLVPAPSCTPPDRPVCSAWVNVWCGFRANRRPPAAATSCFAPRVSGARCSAATHAVHVLASANAWQGFLLLRPVGRALHHRREGAVRRQWPRSPPTPIRVAWSAGRVPGPSASNYFGQGPPRRFLRREGQSRVFQTAFIDLGSANTPFSCCRL